MAYPSDLRAEEWQLIEKYFEPTDKRGNQSKHTKQQVVNAILYVVRTGVQWRYLPQDFPPWKTVYDHYSKWNKRGTWDNALKAITELARKKTVAKPRPAMESLTLKASKPSTTVKNAAMMAVKK
jgi:putative transposase